MKNVAATANDVSGATDSGVIRRLRAALQGSVFEGPMQPAAKPPVEQLEVGESGAIDVDLAAELIRGFGTSVTDAFSNALSDLGLVRLAATSVRCEDESESEVVPYALYRLHERLKVVETMMQRERALHRVELAMALEKGRALGRHEASAARPSDPPPSSERRIRTDRAKRRS